jgi:hypothetical protein
MKVVFVFAKINKMYQTLVRFLAPISKMINVGRKNSVFHIKAVKRG